MLTQEKIKFFVYFSSLENIALALFDTLKRRIIRHTEQATAPERCGKLLVVCRVLRRTLSVGKLKSHAFFIYRQLWGLCQKVLCYMVYLNLSIKSILLLMYISMCCLLSYNYYNYDPIEISSNIYKFVSLASFSLFGILTYIDFLQKRYITFVIFLLISIFFNPIFDIQYNDLTNRYVIFEDEFIWKIYQILIAVVVVTLVIDLALFYYHNKKKQS